MVGKTGKMVVSLIIGATLSSGTGLAVNVPAFNDVDSSTDYQEAILWTVETGITSGYGNGLWGPDDCVKRAELMKMVMEFGGESILGGVPASTSAFSDIGSKDWFYKYVMLAHQQGYIDGYADGTFQPNRCVNRAEAMKIAVNVLIGDGSLYSSTGPMMYDDKLVVDVSSRDWFGPYAKKLFKDRLVGTKHTSSAGTVADAPMINFYPAGDMSRKEVAEMLYRIHQYVVARQ